MKLGDIKSDQEVSDVIEFNKQFAALAEVVITNTTTKTSALSASFAGIGKIIAANKLKKGSIIRMRISGLITIPALLPGNLVLGLELGGVTVASATITSSLLGLLALTNSAFDATASLLVRNDGVSGSVIPGGSVGFMTGAGRQFADLVNAGSPSTINTTIPNTVDMTLKWSDASTSRSVKVTLATINLEN